MPLDPVTVTTPTPLSYAPDVRRVRLPRVRVTLQFRRVWVATTAVATSLLLTASVIAAERAGAKSPLAVPAATIPVGSFVRLSDDEGLAHSDVRAIAQDHQGFMWFGLRLAGLTRYDGYELKVYAHDPANPRTIGHRIIWSLLVDRAGRLWIGTEGGVDRYDRATDSFVHYRHDASRPDSLSNSVVVCLFQDAAGKIWAGTRDGLCRLDDEERGVFTTFRRPQAVPGSAAPNTYRSIMEDTTTGLFWLGATDGLTAFDPRTGAFATYVHDSADDASLSRNAVNKVLRDEYGVFWAFTEYGVNSFRPTFDRVEQHRVQQPRIEFRRFIQPGGIASPGVNFVRDGLVDRKHRLWLATRGGVFFFDRTKETFTGYTRNPSDAASISDDLVQAIFEDRSGNIWTGTFAGGVNRLRSEAKPFRTHHHVPGDPRSVSEDRIAGLAIDPQGRLWAATVDGLNRRDSDGWTRFLHDPADPHSLPSNDLSTVAVAPNGDVWVGSNYSGAYRFDQTRFHSYPTSPAHVPAANGWHPFTGGQVNSFLPDATGGVWIGARAYGVDYFKDGQFLHFNPQDATADSAEQPTTNAIFGFIAKNGQVWFATELHGLVRFDPDQQRFTAFRPRKAVGSTSLHCVAQGDENSIWLGAADGLHKFDMVTETFVRRYSPEDGLPHAAVMTIVRDRRGHLWLGTANGLSDFDPVAERFRNYEKPDGLPANVFSQRAGVVGPDGRVYLGTRAGIVEFAPEELQDNPEPPPVVITELRWLGPPPLNAHGERPTSILNIGETIRVPAGQPGFSLKFSALDFTAPEKNRFRYRLEGWDDDWIPSTARERSTTYTALPPGTYTFRVKGSNADQVWNEQGAALRIIVEPFFWQTVWFRVALGALVIGVVAAGQQARLRVIRRRNLHLEEQVSQRTAQLQEEVAVRERAEAALRESHAALEHRVRERTAELARTNASLQEEIAERIHVEAQLRQSQKMEAIGQLAGGVAHDFNNLLTVILGQSELLADSTLTTVERDSAVRDIKAAAQRATNLTRQLLVLSRHQAMTQVAINLNEVVASVGKLLRHVIGEHIILETKLDPQPLGVLADAGMLEQVLLNLAVNARDAMSRGGRLTIATSRVQVAPGTARPVGGGQPSAGDCVRVSVSDTGSGIPQHILPQIFEPFFTTKESGKGTGLGLAISLGIVQKHRGWIELETRPERGTTFHVFLPAHALSAPVAPAAPDAPPHSGGNLTVMVAEDETAVRTIVQRVLTRQGYRVIEAGSGPEALQQWARHRKDIAVLVTDIVMPGNLTGHELAAKLLADKPTLRVVTMSGYDPSDLANTGTALHPHVRKPFSAEELLAAIDRTAAK